MHQNKLEDVFNLTLFHMKTYCRLHRRHRLSGQSFSVVQDGLMSLLLKVGGPTKFRSLSNVVRVNRSQMGPKCILSAFQPVLRDVLL